MVINHTVKLNKLYKYITENVWTIVQLYVHFVIAWDIFKS